MKKNTKKVEKKESSMERYVNTNKESKYKVYSGTRQINYKMNENNNFIDDSMHRVNYPAQSNPYNSIFLIKYFFLK